jgi:hypothetical protein
VKESLSKMNFEILILHFKKKNCFDVSLKYFAFEILQLPDFFCWETRLFVVVSTILPLVKVHHDVTFCFCGFQSGGLEKKLKVLFERNLSFF